MTTNSFPWGEVVSNAVWICGLAVILAALGWHDYKRRELKERNLKAAAATKAEPLMKPVLLGLIMVTGGLALSVRSPMLAAIFAVAAFGLVIVLAKRFFLQRTKSTVGDKERRRQALSAAGQGDSGLGDLSENHDKYLAEAYAEDEKKDP
jgi:membrane protein implicated in regulation of membrane protease activity